MTPRNRPQLLLLSAALLLGACATSSKEVAPQARKPVTVQLIRSATLKVGYAGKTFLVDPMLSARGAMDPFAGKARNPTVDLPIPPGEVMAGVDAVLVTHAHPDHFDPAAAAAIPSALPVFIQPSDAAALGKVGAARAVDSQVEWGGVTIHRTGGKHGSGDILKAMGEVSGYVLQAPNAPTLYVVGDTVWTPEVADALKRFSPDLVVTFSGRAVIPGHEATPILMGSEDTLTVLRTAAKATVVAVHLESLDHLTVTREALRRGADEASIAPSRLRIPADGETLVF